MGQTAKGWESTGVNRPTDFAVHDCTDSEGMRQPNTLSIGHTKCVLRVCVYPRNVRPFLHTSSFVETYTKIL